MKTRMIGGAIVLLAAVAALVGFISFWPPKVALKNVPENEIPTEIVNRVHDRSANTKVDVKVENLIWRAQKTEGNISWAAYTAKVQYPNESKTDYYYIYFDVNGAGGGSGTRFAPSSAFSGGGGKAIDAESKYTLYGSGYVLDRRVTAIVGKAQTGETVRSEPVDGFWFIALEGKSMQAQWSVIEALDVKGHVLHQIKTPQ